MYTADEAREQTKKGYLEYLLSYPDVKEAVEIFDAFVSTSAFACNNYFYIRSTSSYEGSQHILNMEHRDEFIRLIKLYGYDVELQRDCFGNLTGLKISW